jgi:hypothetical protein
MHFSKIGIKGDIVIIKDDNAAIGLSLNAYLLNALNHSINNKYL